MLICTRKSGCMKLGGHNGDCEVQSRGEYTPTPDQLADWLKWVIERSGENSNGVLAEYRRMIAEVERAAAARALDLAAHDLSRPSTGAGYDAWASGAGDWLRARADEMRERKIE